MALLTHQLVGRAEELGSLEQVLAEVDRGDAAVVALVGEPGIGKSCSSETFRSRCSSTHSTSTCAGSTRVACDIWTRTY